MDKSNFAGSIHDRVAYVLTKYESKHPEGWSFNQFFRVYAKEWMRMELPKKLDSLEGVETISRRLRELKEMRHGMRGAFIR